MKNRVEIKKFNNYNSNQTVKTELCYNFLPTDELNQSFSLKTATFPRELGAEEVELGLQDEGIQAVKGVTSFRQFDADNKKSIYRLLIYGDDKKVYINQLLSGNRYLFWLYKLTFENAPIALCYKDNDTDAIILADNTKMVVWKTYLVPYEVSGIPIITSMCMNDSVLFCTIKEPAFKIWYATDLNAENVGNISNNSGYIPLNDELGDAKKVVAFDEDVYVFREYGISKINYLQKDITTSQVYASNSRILENTVSVCGNLILFMTFDGIYTFNGTRVSKTDIDIKDLLDGINSNATASSISHYYFLALRLNFNDDVETDLDDYNYVNNAVLVIDTDNLSFHIMRGVDVLQFYPLKTEVFEKMLVISNTKDKEKLLEVEFKNNGILSANKFWQSGDLTDNNKTKLFTSLCVLASKDVTFTFIYDDGKSITFNTQQDGLNEFRFRLVCKSVKLQITSANSLAEVKRVSMEYYDY